LLKATLNQPNSTFYWFATDRGIPMRISRMLASASLSIILAGCLSLIVGGAANAAPASDGAQHVDYEFCNFDGYATSCFAGTSVFNATSTPNGFSINNYHNRGTSTYNSPTCSAASSGFDRTNYVLSTSGTNVYSVTSSLTSTFSCEGQPAPTCTTKFVFALANGVVRLSSYTTTCS